MGMAFTLPLVMVPWVFAAKDLYKLVVVDDDGNKETIEWEGLEVGESHEFLSNSGKEVVLEISEEGLLLFIDGEEIELPMKGAHKLHWATDQDVEMQMDGKHKMIVMGCDPDENSDVENT